jgi:hypothetical protein
MINTIVPLPNTRKPLPRIVQESVVFPRAGVLQQNYLKAAYSFNNQLQPVTVVGKQN